MALMKVGVFEVLAEIAAGRNGRVYKALDPVTQRPVALRVLASNDSPQFALLQNAVRAAASLASPNVGVIYEVLLKNGALVVVMEYLEGRSLRSLLTQEKTIGYMELVDFTRQVGSAIDHATSRGVAHHNLHPGNINQEWDGALKLMDYGLEANPMSPDSLRYFSPEQANGMAVDGRSNLFSWGAILYEAALGKKAFEGETTEVVLANIRAGSFVAPQTVNPKLHSGICAVIVKSLAPRPEDRYQSGAELIREFESCTKAPPVKVALDAPAKPPEKQPWQAAKVPEAHFAPTPALTRAPALEKVPVPEPVTSPLPTVSPLSNASATASAPKPAIDIPSHPVAPREPDKANITAQPTVTVPVVENDTVHKSPETQPPAPKAGFFVIESKAQIAASPAAPVRPAKPQAPKPNKQTRTKFNAPFPPKQLIVGACLLLGIAVIALVVSTSRHHRTQEQAPPPLSQPSALEVPEIVESSQTDLQAQTDNSLASPATPRPRKEKKTVVIAPAAPTAGDIFVESFPTGATVQVDGRHVGVTPVTVSQLSPGQHLVTLSLADHAQASRTVEVAAGQRVDIALQLSEVPATVSILSTPAGASIYLNGKETGKVTPSTLQLTKGHYSVELKKLGFVEATAAFDAAAGQSLSVSPQFVQLANAADVKEVGKLKRMFGGASTAGLTKVRIRTNPKGAEVELNRRRLNKPSPTEAYAPPGVYDVTLSLPGYKTIQKRVTISGAEAAIDETMERQ